MHAQFEDFIRSFLSEHATAQSWPPRGDKGLFEYVLNNLRLAYSSNGAEEREIIKYYRFARNVISHPDIKITRLENQRRKVRKMLKVNKDGLPPKALGRFDYGDFFLFTCAVKDYAAVICQTARPSDSEIAKMIAPAVKSLNRFKNKPSRYQNSLRQFLQMNTTPPSDAGCSAQSCVSQIGQASTFRGV